MNKIKLGFWFIWGLPQNVIGYLMYLYFKYEKNSEVIKYKDAYVINYGKKNIGAVSLGQFIFLWSDFHNKERIIKHEYGHTRQSHLLGFLYLFVIGVPSIVWATFFKKYRRKTGKSYYDFYTERWANKLGGL